MSIENKKCENENIVKGFPYFRPDNQLPFPAVAGMLLVTKSDFTLPARPDLLEWKLIESVIGVSDVNMSFSEDGLSATIYKTINNEVIEVGTIGIIDRENAEKLNKITYVRYILQADSENHTLKLYGIKADDTSELIGEEISYISYNEYRQFKESTESDINTINNQITGMLQRISTNETNISTNSNNISQLILDVTAINTKISSDIMPYINQLIQATNPNLVLKKGADGISLEWANILALSDVTAVIDTPNHLIKLYKTLNGVESLICNITDIDYTTFDNIKNKVLQISNNLDESSTAGYVLTKINATDYDWREIDLSDYYTKYETDNLLNGKLSKTDIILLTWQEYLDMPTHDENKFYFITDKT